MQESSTPISSPAFTVRVESHCIGCNTCVMLCDTVFALKSGAAEEQKSYVKDDAPLQSEESNIDLAVQMCPVTAIIKESN